MLIMSHDRLTLLTIWPARRLDLRPPVARHPQALPDPFATTVDIWVPVKAAVISVNRHRLRRLTRLLPARRKLCELKHPVQIDACSHCVRPRWLLVDGELSTWCSVVSARGVSTITNVTCHLYQIATSEQSLAG